jgi:hypothetical protein
MNEKNHTKNETPLSFYDHIIEELIKDPEGINRVEIKSKDLATPKSHFDKIQDQRHFQRRILFGFALSSTIISMLGLFFIIGYPIYLKIFGKPTIELLGKYELSTYAAGVFAQFISVIVVITKSLWDDTPYKEALEKNDCHKTFC